MKIDLIIYDFDGVMTNNQVLVMQDGKEAVFCNRDDGWAIATIRKDFEIEQLILTSESNPVVVHRARKLNLKVVGGISNKASWLTRFCKIRNFSINNVLYVGNGLNDLEVMKIVGCSIAPKGSHPDIIKIADFVTKRKGGEGVLIEVLGYLKGEI